MTEKAKKLGNEFITGVFCNIPENVNQGLTKREYFAALAMQGLMNYLDDYSYEQSVVQDAVGYADDLLEELSKNE